MIVARISAKLPYDVRAVWNTVTSLDSCAWRSDLSRIEILDERRFVEYTKAGHATRFTITASEFCSLWEFDLENKNLRGHWIGVFTPQKTGTMVEFTEQIDVRNPLMRLFARLYLKRQQAGYLADLRAELERKRNEMQGVV